MKKTISVAFLSLLLILAIKENAHARFYNRLFVTARVPADDAKDIINDIIAVIGLKPNFEVKASGIPNAAAVAYNGKRYIIYNPQFISRLNAAAGNKWASVSVLAHEMGHHLNGHTLLNVGSQPGLELEADEFSGFILRKMGATLAQSQAAMKVAASYKPSLTHPGQQDRLAAIATGWNNGVGKPSSDMAKYSKPAPQVDPEDNIYTGDNKTVGPRPQQSVVMIDKKSAQTYPGNSVLDSRYIMGTVNFPADNTGDYYLTVRYNLVKVIKGQVYLVAKMLRTDNENYPYVLKGDPRYTLFVDKYGKIVTANKQVAGYLKII